MAQREHDAGAQPREAPQGLPTKELLAKIDSLEWGDTVIPGVTTNATEPFVTAAPKPERMPPRLAFLATMAVAALLVGLLVLYWQPTETAKPAVAEVPPAPSAAPEPPVQPSSVADDVANAAAEAQERERLAKVAREKSQSEARAARKEEVQRRAREEEQVRLEKQQQEIQRQQEDSRRQAERQAAEAAAKARIEPVPRGPSSPQELCADRANFLARGFCEVRACGAPEWRNHPYCVKRMEEQIRNVGHGNSPGPTP